VTTSLPAAGDQAPVSDTDGDPYSAEALMEQLERLLEGQSLYFDDLGGRRVLGVRDVDGGASGVVTAVLTASDTTGGQEARYQLILAKRSDSP
jgi:hypothetical protein